MKKLIIALMAVCAIGVLAVDYTPVTEEATTDTATFTAATIDTLTTGTSLTTTGVGTLNTTNVTSVIENGDSVSHQTVITMAGTPSAIADGAFEASQLLYTFPEGRILIEGVTCDLTLTMATTNFNATTNDLYVFALGSTVNDDGDGTISATGSDLIAETSIDTENGATQTNTVTTALAASAHFDGTTTAKIMYMNWAVPAANDSGANTNSVTGTITVTWKNLGDY